MAPVALVNSAVYALLGSTRWSILSALVAGALLLLYMYRARAVQVLEATWPNTVTLAVLVSAIYYKPFYMLAPIILFHPVALYMYARRATLLGKITLLYATWIPLLPSGLSLPIGRFLPLVSLEARNTPEQLRTATLILGLPSLAMYLTVYYM